MQEEEYGPDLLTLVDDEGNEHDFEVLDVIDNDEGSFYALLPTFSDAEDKVDSHGTYYIFEAIEENGEQRLAEVDDDDLLNKLADEFERRFEKYCSENGEDDGDNDMD